MKVTIRKVRPTKRIIIFTLLGLLIAALATYAVFSYNAWTNLSSFTYKASSDLKKAMGELGDTNSKTPDQRITAIRNTFDKTYRTQQCAPSGFFDWQAIIPQLDAIKKDCEDSAKRTDTALKALGQLEAFYKDDAALAAEVSTILEASKNLSNIPEVRAKWVAFAELQTFAGSNHTGIEPVYAEYKTLASRMYTALIELERAITKEDKAAYDASITKLEAVYADFPAVKTTAETSRDSLVNAVVGAYEAL